MVISYLGIIKKIAAKSNVSPKASNAAIKLGEWAANDKRSKEELKEELKNLK